MFDGVENLSGDAPLRHKRTSFLTEHLDEHRDSCIVENQNKGETKIEGKHSLRIY